MEIFKRRYLNLIREFSTSWFKLRDQRTILGLFWSFLNPLIMTAILYFLFKSRMSVDGDRGYFLYILIGTVSWNFFVVSTQQGLAVLLRRANMVRNVVFPKEILVFSQIGTYIIQHIFEILVVFLFIIIGKIGFSLHLLLLPVIILMVSCIIAGLSLMLSCVCVYARDLEYIWSVFARMGFFLVPVFYKVSSLSPQFRWVVVINPMTQIINFYRDILLYHRFPNLFAFILMLLFSFIFLISGYKFFKLYEPKIVERV